MKKTAHATAGRLASDFISTGNPDYLSAYAQAVQAVDADQVVAAAKRYLQQKRMITVRLLPQKGAAASLTRPSDEKALVLSGPTRKLDLDNERLLRAFRSVRATGGEATSSAVGQATMFRLPNGLRVIHQRSTRLPIVAAQWYELGGLMGDTPGREGVANAVSRMMIKGAGGLSARCRAPLGVGPIIVGPGRSCQAAKVRAQIPHGASRSVHDARQLC